jgi:hypothetical protein
MLVDMIFVRMVEVTIVQIVYVATVAHSGMSAVRPVLMRMVGMGGAEQDVMGWYPFCVQDPRTPRCGSRPHGR